MRAVGLEPTLLAERDFEQEQTWYDHLRRTTLKLDNLFFYRTLSLIIIVRSWISYALIPGAKTLMWLLENGKIEVGQCPV